MLGSRLRWVAPVAVIVAAAGVAAAPRLSAAAAPSLPRVGARALVAEALHPRVSGLSATVRVSTDLGLPSLPAASTGGSGSLVSALLGGTAQTLRVWQEGRARLRVAWLQPGAEQDLFVDAGTVWTWDSATQTARELTRPRLPVARGGRGWVGRRRALPACVAPFHRAGHRARAGRAGSGERACRLTLRRERHLVLPVRGGDRAMAAFTPQRLAHRLLAAVSPTTRVRVGPAVRVAGRPAYQLEISPRQAGSLVSAVRVDVDGATGLVLGVLVMAHGQHAPALSVTDTAVSLSPPPASMFRFSPPAGVTVHRAHRSDAAPGRLPRRATGRRRATGAAGRPRVLGRGWTAVLAVPGLHLGAAELQALDAVSTPDAGGRLFTSSLLTGYLAGDGTLYLGAVTPSRLLAAAGA